MSEAESSLGKAEEISGEKVWCPNCGLLHLPEEGNSCRECDFNFKYAEQIEASEKGAACPDCGQILPKGSDFCNSCGLGLLGVDWSNLESNEILPTEFSAESFSVPKSPDNPNEDSVIVDEKELFYAVFDGVGGTEGGEIASSQAAEYFNSEVSNGRLGQGDQLALGTAYELEKMIGEVKEKFLQDKDYPEKATTASLLKLFKLEDGNVKAYAINIGDSRIYLFRDKKLFQITIDDNKIYDAIKEQDGGRLEKARKVQDALSESKNPMATFLDLKDDPKSGLNLSEVPFKPNAITQCLDAQMSVRPNIYKFYVKKGDKVIIMSDGVSDNCTTAQMEKILLCDDNLAEELVAFAKKASTNRVNSRKKPDDMTAVVVDCK